MDSISSEALKAECLSGHEALTDELWRGVDLPMPTMYAFSSRLEDEYALGLKFSRHVSSEDARLWRVDPTLSRRLPLDVVLRGGRIVVLNPDGSRQARIVGPAGGAARINV